MAKCRMCGKKGLFLRLNKFGLCSECEESERMRVEKEEKERQARIEREKLIKAQEEEAARIKKERETYAREYFRSKIDDWYLMYSYRNVKTSINGEKFYHGDVNISAGSGSSKLIISNEIVGEITDQKRNQMVLDFIRRDEKILVKMDSPTTIYMGFYKKLLDGVDESNSCLYKLIKTSKKDSLFDSPRYESIEGMDDGEVVSLHYDDETETYIVYDLSGAELGEISKSDSKKIANKSEEYNAVPVITEIDYDEKDRPTAKIKVYFK